MTHAIKRFLVVAHRHKEGADVRVHIVGPFESESGRDRSAVAMAALVAADSISYLDVEGGGQSARISKSI